MSEVGQDAAENIAADTEVSQPTETTEAAQPNEVEQRALRMKWKPKDEYIASGKDESTWVSAEDYVNKIEADLPALREHNKKLSKTVDKLLKKTEDGNKLLSDMVERSAEKERQAVQRALREAEAQRKEAISNGDVETAERLSDDIAEHRETLKAPIKVEKPVPSHAEVPEEVVQWAEENRAWFVPGEPEHAVAIAFYGKQDRGLSESEKLRLTKAEVVRRFPEKFSNTRRVQPPAVETGNGNGSRRNVAKGWNDLPAEDRQIAERLIKQGAVKDRDAYVKSYRW